ncbi:metalloaminopeptidase APE1 [Kluyveromyces lactis]|uniref:KLLA0F13574p n=1 Tax=Kluyveromyces lactis (strain ATCC 8585 / CBS 2359 / DSM 70799 / NBRC 1267 / NRRL Y-1140 / WM37) TaxID=284590 RepID=Q6CK48_KLULA|nr:uncharacterized protein KLLA0_F13574g [Kluyveromyces lactis]CAG98399.1 KLLA0F13574p [Kluyveromyces lactis]|eukprot:XP_455691.1 uncharacterized protein KLLA0_F13574g [Kluyveromyces lactis]
MTEHIEISKETINALSDVLKQLAVIEPRSRDVNNQNDKVTKKSTSKQSQFSNKATFREYSQEYIDFTYENPTIYHVVKYFAKKLEENGFGYLSEKSSWSNVEPGHYYTTRNGTNLCAFAVGPEWKPELGVGIIGAHIDALTAKLKPSSKKPDVEGFELLGVAPYGGTLNELWLDRDLGIGGRVLIKDPDTGKISSHLCNSAPHPIARIPSLAPHFGAPSVGPFDKEDQTVPVIGYVGNGDYDDDDEDHDVEDEKKSPLYGKHSIHLLRYIAKLLSVKVSAITQFDLDLFDVQKGTFGGLKDEFIFVPRIDDRICSFSAINGLIEHKKTGHKKDGFNVAVLYDDEEVGSLTRQGAKGGLLESVVERIVASRGNDVSETRTAFANSIIISADVTHMLNPNFNSVYLENHKPKPNVGITLALDSNAHMATDVVGTALVEELGRLNGDKIQYFQIKNNSRSGGTIGPSLASQTGARTIDMGIAQWSMHSIRATTGSKDIGLAVKFFNGFYNDWNQVYQSFGDL